MIKNAFILLMVGIFNVGLLSGYAQQQSNIEDLFEGKVEVYFSFKTDDIKVLSALTRTISIDNYQDGVVYAYANKNEFSRFLKEGYEYQILPSPGSLINPKMMGVNDLKGIMEWDSYPTYDAYVEMMYQFETDYPGLCKIYSIGTLASGRELLVAKISDNINEDEDEPEFLYTSTMHGDETAGYILMLRLIDDMLTNYGSDARITNMVNEMEIWINPNANPDGTYAGGNNTVNGSTRSNANGVDLNRNYPDPEDGQHPDGNDWQPETVFFMDFAEAHDFSMAANFHGGIELVNYPWDTWSTRAADDDWWIMVSREYADTCQLNSPNGYMTGEDNGITNGYDWYEVAGGRQDYMNYEHNCREFVLELSNTKLVPESQLDNHWEYNYRSLYNYLEQALYGVRGIVTDAESGDPIEAKVFCEEHDIDNSEVFSHLPLGNYHRMLKEGSYDITFSALGYYSQTFENVAISDYEILVMDVQLQPKAIEAMFSANQTEILPGQSIQFTDNSWGNVTTWEWVFEGGNPATSNVQNPSVTYDDEGAFDVSLTVTDAENNTHTLSLQNFITVANTILIENGEVTTCSGIFYDNGGADGEYGNNADYIFTIHPGVSDAKVKVEFIEFDVESNPGCTYDYLEVYDGTSASGSPIGHYCGTDIPESFIGENDGSLTFKFHSDGSETHAGWKAIISCIQIPEANFEVNTPSIYIHNSVQFSDLSTNDPTSWTWEFEGGNPATSNDQNPEVVYDQFGVFNVTLTAGNESGTDVETKADYIVVDWGVGIEQIENHHIAVYPNPVIGDNIRIKGIVEVSHIEVVDLTGRVLIVKTINSKEAQIDLNNLDNGMYMLRLHTKFGVLNKKIELR